MVCIFKICHGNFRDVPPAMIGLKKFVLYFPTLVCYDQDNLKCSLFNSVVRTVKCLVCIVGLSTMDSAECSVEILRTMFERYLLKHSLLQSCFNVEVGKLLEPVVWLRPEKSSRPCSLDSARTVIEKPAIRLFLNYFPKMLQGCSYANFIIESFYFRLQKIIAKCIYQR